VHVLKTGIKKEQRLFRIGFQGVEVRKGIWMTAGVQNKPGAPAFVPDFFKGAFGINNLAHHFIHP